MRARKGEWHVSQNDTVNRKRELQEKRGLQIAQMDELEPRDIGCLSTFCVAYVYSLSVWKIRINWVKWTWKLDRVKILLVKYKGEFYYDKKNRFHNLTPLISSENRTESHGNAICSSLCSDHILSGFY